MFDGHLRVNQHGHDMAICSVRGTRGSVGGQPRGHRFCWCTDVIDFLAYLFGLGFLIIRKTNYLEITPFLERKSISMFIRKPSASLLVPKLALVNRTEFFSVRFPSDFFFSR